VWGWRSEVKVPSEGGEEESVPGYSPNFLWFPGKCCCLWLVEGSSCPLPSLGWVSGSRFPPFYKDTSHTGLESTPKTSS
jgi:hypothetical protein